MSKQKVGVSQLATPARLEMLWGRLLSISDEMAVTLRRTAFSQVVREAHDYGCAVFDAKGNLLAIASDATPGLSVSTMVSVVNLLEALPAETLQPGDVLITNDPWLATGHLLDLTIVTPVFYEGNLAGFTAAVAHHLDIGGRKYTPATTEIYEEGLFLPPLKLCVGGQANDTIFRILASNVRASDLVLGDVHSQLAANELGARRICEMLSENEWENLNLLGTAILDRAEAATRNAIVTIPNGTYGGELLFDGFDEDLRLMVTIDVLGERMSIDFGGTSPQVQRGINSVLNYTKSMTLMAIKMLIDSLTPINSGCMRPLEVQAPAGSIVNASFPAPVVGRSLTGHQIQPLIFLALAETMPEKTCAMSCGPIWGIHIYGKWPSGLSFLGLQLLNGGMGARSDLDGEAALSFPGNVASIPVEAFEAELPLLVERKALLPDSGGAGKRRGGLGQEFRLRVLDDFGGEITVSTRAERTRNPAMGLKGGRQGLKGQVLRNGVEDLHPKKSVQARAGDVIMWQLAGGGGYGDPLRREPERVLADVVEGRISAAAAERDYGVVVHQQAGEILVDWAATESLRQPQTSQLLG